MMLRRYHNIEEVTEVATDVEPVEEVTEEVADVEPNEEAETIEKKPKKSKK